jgi:hypothetical protein
MVKLRIRGKHKIISKAQQHIIIKPKDYIKGSRSRRRRGRRSEAAANIIVKTIFFGLQQWQLGSTEV